MPGDIICSPKLRKYFDELDSRTKHAYEFANKAKANGFDPEKKVDIILAKSVGKRVEGIIAAMELKIIDSGVAERITELEKQYGPGDWRVGLTIAWEVADQKFFKMDDEEHAIGIGIRTGLAYTTNGVVSAPLEGLAEIKLRPRNDGKKYISLFFSGPIRGAGASQQVVTLVIADYVRIKKGIEKYDPTPDEINRYYTEVTDYYERVERKQYKPEKEEMDIIIKNISVEINGDPTSDIEVSNYKNLPRIETNRIRGGMSLVLTDGVVKYPKIWKQLEANFYYKQLDFYEGFNDAEIWEIIRACIWQEFEPGTEVIIEGDVDDAFYIIVSGDVQVFRNTTLVGELHTGDCFGEMGHLANMERTATIRAKNYIRLMKINSTMIDQLSVACQLHFNKVFLRTLVKRLSLTTNRAIPVRDN